MIYLVDPGECSVGLIIVRRRGGVFFCIPEYWLPQLDRPPFLFPFAYPQIEQFYYEGECHREVDVSFFNMTSVYGFKPLEE